MKGHGHGNGNGGVEEGEGKYGGGCGVRWALSLLRCICLAGDAVISMQGRFARIRSVGSFPLCAYGYNSNLFRVPRYRSVDIPAQSTAD